MSVGISCKTRHFSATRGAASSIVRSVKWFPALFGSCALAVCLSSPGSATIPTTPADVVSAEKRAWPFNVAGPDSARIAAVLGLKSPIRLVSLETMWDGGSTRGTLLDSEGDTLTFFVPNTMRRLDEVYVRKIYIEAAPTTGFARSPVHLRSPVEAALASAFEESADRLKKPLHFRRGPGSPGPVRLAQANQLLDLAIWLRSRTDDGHGR